MRSSLIVHKNVQVETWGNPQIYARRSADTRAFQTVVAYMLSQQNTYIENILVSSFIFFGGVQISSLLQY